MSGFLITKLDSEVKKNVEAVSRKMVLNKSSDLIPKNSGVFRKFRRQAREIKELKLKWNEKMVALQEKGFTEKDMLNLKLENQKLEDLEFLRTQIPPGPFTKKEEVTDFMEVIPESKEKDLRMYKEIWFQKNSTTAIKKDAPVF